MKTILIAWFILSGGPVSESVTVEFDSMRACQEAGTLLQTVEKTAKGRNPRWNFICVPKDVEEPE